MKTKLKKVLSIVLSACGIITTAASIFDSLQFNSDYLFRSLITNGWKTNEKRSKPKSRDWNEARFIYKMKVTTKQNQITNNNTIMIFQHLPELIILLH